METIELYDKLLLASDADGRSQNGETSLPFQEIRSSAAERFRALGFPTVRHEEWKYTNIIPLTKHDYSVLPEISLPSEALPPTPEFIPKNSIKIILINGIFSPDFSLREALPDGITITSLHDERQRPETAGLFGKFLAFSDNAFTALNTAFARNGVFIRIAPGTIAERPIAVLNYTDARSAAMLAQPRLLIMAERHSQATIIEHTTTIGGFPALVNAASEIVVGEDAALQHYVIQDDAAAAITASQVRQTADSRYSSVTLTLGGTIVRNTVGAELAGTNAETHFYGLALGSGRRLIDNHTSVDHAAPHCQSSELYKHILDDRSTAVFNGKVFVRKDAQKTNAYQSNRTLLLSDGATINTKPQLEIFADDVKCSHGATSGYLDDESLFYLRSRGISEEKAKALLFHAFAGEILDKIHLAEMRSALDTAIASRLHDED